MDVAGRSGDDITLDSFAQAAKAQGIKSAQVAAIIDEVRTAVNDFARYAAPYGLKPSTLTEVDRTLKRGLTRFVDQSAAGS